MHPDRFVGLFEAFHRPLLAYAMRRTATLADAEDAVADVFLVAWRRLDAVPSGDGALPWLYGVARRVLANQRRGQARRTRLQAALESQAAEPRPSAVAVTVPSPALDALARLSAADQELLRLVAWEELTHAEIGQVLGITVNAVAIRLHRARARYAAALAGRAVDEVKGWGRFRTWSGWKGSTSGRPTREER